MEPTEQEEPKSVDVNIYDDVPDFDLGEEIEKLKTENQTLTDHIKALEEEIEKLLSTITKLKETQDNLTKNTASLFLTARAEIERKDRMIADLRTEIENIGFRRRNPDECKRKGQESSASELNIAKRFKYDRYEDAHQDRPTFDDGHQKGPGFDEGRQERPVFDDGHEDRPRFDGGHQDRHIFDDGREDGRIFDDRRRYDDRHQDGSRFEDDHQEGRIFDDGHRDRPSSWSRYSAERYNSQNNRSRSGSRERFDVYRSDTGRRYDAWNRRGYGRARRFVSREKWTNDRDEMLRPAHKSFGYRESRNSSERLNYTRRNSPSTQYRDEADQNRHEDRKTGEKFASDRHGKENVANVDKIPQTLESKNTETKETISKEHKAKILGHVTLNSSKYEKTSEVTVTKKDVPGTKLVKKRLKMLDVVEEKVKKIKSTPVKLSNSSSANQTRRSPNRDVKGVAKSLSRDLETKCKGNSDKVRDSRKSFCSRSAKSSRTEELKPVAARNRSPAEKRSKDVRERSKSITQSDLKGTRVQDSEKKLSAGKRYLFSESSADGDSADSDLVANILQKSLLERVSAETSAKEDRTEPEDRKYRDEHLPKEHSTVEMAVKKEISKDVARDPHKERTSERKAEDEPSEVVGDCKQKETPFAEDPKNKIMTELKDEIAEVCKRVTEVQAEKQDQRNAEFKDAPKRNVVVDHKEKEDKPTEKKDKEGLVSKKGNKNIKEPDKSLEEECKPKGVLKGGTKSPIEEGEIEEGEIEDDETEENVPDGRIEKTKKGKAAAKIDVTDGRVPKSVKQLEEESKGKTGSQESAKNTASNHRNEGKEVDSETDKKFGRNVGVQKGTTVPVTCKKTIQDKQPENKDKVPLKENKVDTAKSFKSETERKAEANSETKQDVNRTVDGKKEKEGKQLEKEDKKREEKKESVNHVAESCKDQKEKKVTKRLDKDETRNEGTKENKSANFTSNCVQEKEAKQPEKASKQKVGPREGVSDIINNWKNETIERIIKDAKRSTGIKEAHSNIAEKCKKEKGDKPTEKEDKRKQESKKNEEKQTTKRSSKEDKQSVGASQHTSKDDAGQSRKKLKEGETAKNDTKPNMNTEFAMESCKKKKNETDKQPTKQDRKSIELKENVTNIVTHKNEGAKSEERRVSISLNMIPDEKILEEGMKKAESFPKETRKSSKKPETSAKKQNPNPIGKNLLEEANLKVSTKDDANKGSKTSSNLRARRSSVKDTQEKIAPSEEKLRGKAPSTNKDQQKDAKLPDKSPIDAVAPQASHETKHSRIDLRKLSSDSSSSTTKKKESSEASTSSKTKKGTSIQSELNVVKVPVKKVGVEVTKSGEKVDKTKTSSKQNLDTEEGRKTEDVNVSCCTSKTTTPSEANATDQSGKSSEECNVINEEGPEKQTSEGETSEFQTVEDYDKQSIVSQTLEPSSSNVPENGKIEKNIHIIDCTIIKKGDACKPPQKDLIRMAMEGILTEDEDKVETSEVDKSDVIDGKLDNLIAHANVGISASENETLAENNCIIKDNSSRNKIKLEEAKKNKIEDISRCLQTKAKSKDKSDSSTSYELTKEISQILRESSTSTGTLSKTNVPTTKSNLEQSSSPDRPITKRRITPTPVKDGKPMTSFENILGNTRQSASFTNISMKTSPLHLTHEGEIPVLHLEENHINSLPTETNINDKNIMTLLDTMNISNVERCELPRFKSASNETATDLDADFRNGDLNISPIRGGNNLSFENIISKSTSTPVEVANVSKDNATNVPSSSLGSVTNSSANTVDSTSVQTSTSATTFIRRRRRCRLVIRD